MGPRLMVVVGASLGGLRAAEALRREGFDGRLCIIGEEAVMPYNRPPLSKQILTGSSTEDEIVLPPAEDLQAEWRLGSPATHLDRRNRTVYTAAGDSIEFDSLVIATGVRPRRLLLPGADLSGVHLLRTLSDAQALRADFERGCRLVVVGGGLIGCEVTASARARGLDVTLVNAGPTLMARSLPVEIGSAFGLRHLAHGASVLSSRLVARIEGEDRVRAVVLDDGRRLEADAVVLAVGSEPNTRWLEASGLDVADGVRCDAFCLAVGGEDRIAAVGDVAAWPHLGYGGTVMRVEHWNNAVEQANAAAAALLHGRGRPFAPLPSFWSDQYDCKLQVVGLPMRGDGLRYVAGGPSDPKFLAEAWSGDELVGAVGVNMAARMAGYRARLSTDLTAAAAV